MVIFDNYDMDGYYEEAKAYLMYGLDADDEAEILPTDDEIWQRAYEFSAMDFDDTKLELKQFFGNDTLLMFGYVGRWDGAADGAKIGNFEELFWDAIESCGFIKITDENGHLYIDCSHHDGTNHFEIKKLTDKGYQTYDNWNWNFSDKRGEQEIVNNIINCSFLSHLPHFAKNVYGTKN